ncbi:hypothetical protein [Andreprevotia sp. IGB-42]|nr:hypothetical protein [Andreprevotia sp. IGB-42]
MEYFTPISLARLAKNWRTFAATSAGEIIFSSLNEKTHYGQ